MSEILPNLYLGDVKDAYNYNFLRSKRIVYIINVSDFPNRFGNHFKYIRLPLNDHPNENISQYFTTISKIIVNALNNKQPVLVHCSMGMSRSPTLVIAFLIQHVNMTLDQAFSHVKQRRPIIDPNPGFIEQLNKFVYKN